MGDLALRLKGREKKWWSQSPIFQHNVFVEGFALFGISQLTAIKFVC